MNHSIRSPRLEALEQRLAPAISILFDYRFDDNDFFNDHIDRINVLNMAARDIGARFTDQLSAIPAPAPGNTWKGIFEHPSALGEETAENLVVPANTVIIFVGSEDLGFSRSAAVSSNRSATGTAEWTDTVYLRGQEGAREPNPTDFGPWGGSIAFDRFEDWHFGVELPGNENETDFYSAAQNAILQILGFGNSGVWNFRTATGGFVGPNTATFFPGGVPLNSDRDAWADGTLSQGQLTLMDDELNDGQRVAISELDLAGMQDLGWQTEDTTPLPPPPDPVGPRPPVLPTITTIPTGYRFHASGAGSGLPVSEFTFNEATTFGELARIAPYGTSFTGGVRTATGDLNGDGVEDVIVGPGPGIKTDVQFYNGKTISGNPTGSKFDPILAFEESFQSGVFVAASQVNLDGTTYVAISPDEGGGPRVRLFAFTSAGRSQVNDFFAIDDPNFRGGARAAFGDLNGDGVADLLVSAGFGGGPRIAAFDGKTLGQVQPQKLFPDFFIFEDTLRNGAFVGSGDLNGDGRDDLIAGAGPGGGPRVFVLSGAELLTTGAKVPLANFFAGDVNSRGGVRVTTENIDDDLQDDLITGAGDLAAPGVTTYLGRTITPTNTPPTHQVFQSFDSTISGGVFVG